MNNPKPFQKRIAIVLLAIFIPSLLPVNMLYASNNGPVAPEASSFEPVDATDMVNLATGDMSYVLPLLNVPSPEGGYPLALSYHGGIAYDLESSWIGLGWNLNPGAVERGVNGLPDDWKEALIRTRNYYEFSSTAIDIGVSVGIEGAASIDIGVSYGYDSNGGNYGTVNLGVGTIDGGTDANAGVSVGYHNKSGMIFNVSAGISEGGVGIGGSVGTQGAAVGVNYSFSMGKNKDGSSSPLISTLGISLSSEGIGGSYSLSMGQGSSSFSINSGSLGEFSETNMSVAIPLVVVPVWLKFGKRKIKYEKNETYANFVYGPLYYKDFNYQQGQGSSYSTALSNESNRDFFMDSYEQGLPESESELVSYQDIYQSQKYAFTFPSYDRYVVNAQGLTGAMAPRLFENGTIVGKSQNFEQKDDKIGGGVVFPITGSGVPPAAYLEPNVSGYSGGIYHFGVPTTYEYRTLESFVMNWNYSSSSRKFTKSFGTSLDQNASNQMRFYFENSFPSNLSITPSSLNASGSIMPGYIGNFNSSISSRQHNSNYVEVYTNQQLINNPTLVLRPFNGDNLYDRQNDNGFVNEGIGAYKITTPDGKTYHYAMPVYQYEEVYRQLKKNPSNIGDNDPYNDFFIENSFYHEQRKNQPYATHWVLTAVTGPDYYDANGNGYADSADYGYWTRFDYGKWTDGYCWRTPFNGFNDFDQFANYNQSENAREYGWGRKQLAYLNKVVTRTHTAILVKSLRHDSMSKEIGKEVIGVNSNGQQILGYPSFEGDNGVYYPSQRTMKLDEIILIQNENDNVTAANQVLPITVNPSQTRTVNWHSPIVKNYSPSTNYVQYKINQQSLVIDNGDLPKDSSGNYLIYQNAEKIIKLNQDYSLATNSPHSDAPASGSIESKGRLTLKSIQNLGRNAYNYMPPTIFDYFNNNLPYQDCFNATCNVKNPWGYNNDIPQAWSLQKITTPTGAKIEFELEKDTYWTEAFSRRYWLEDLMFKVTYNSTHVFIDCQNKTGSSVPINFNHYFINGERVFLDLWISNIFDENCLLSNETDIGIVDVIGGEYCYVETVNNDNVRIVANRYSHSISGDDPNRVNNIWFARGNNPTIGSQLYKGGERGSTEHNDGGCGGGASRNHNMYYNILANRTPGEGTGGGLRVKAITSIDESNNRYTTEYDYNHPTKNRTSGITSFAPVRGLKYVPYQTELPAPRVMYEYVTVTEKTTNNGVAQKNGKTVYRFNVLENATNIFDKNITVGDYFKSEVVTNDNLNSSLKVKGAQIKLHDNTSQLGSVISIERYNNANQLMSKSFTKRKTLNELIASTANNSSKGAVQESFQSMKSIHQFNSNYVKAQAGLSGVFVNYTTTQKVHTSSSLSTHNRLLNVSTKVVYTPYTDYTEELNGYGQIQRTWQEDQDAVNGLFNTTISRNSKGIIIKNQIVPAYSVKKTDGTLAYSSMGSKVNNINNKNMLTQEAMTITSIADGSNWKTIDANITTWNDTWKYRNEDTGTDVNETTRKVWRKHKTYAWKDALQADGSYMTNITKDNTQFNWGVGTPLSNKWQKLSEVTRYTRWSSPIETKDINGNFASTKMADNGTKVLVSGNARYTEMYYSGAEYVKSGNLFDGEVKGANYRSTDVAHTGSYSVKSTTGGENLFEVTGSSGNTDYYNNQDNYTATFRPGKYKVSVWALEQGNPTVATVFKVNNVVIPHSDVVAAGCWKQLNYYFDIPANTTSNTIVLTTNQVNGANYYDDFRMCPIASSVNTYVYDQNTDELSYMLDANNMGAAFKYDDAGRLWASYAEVVDSPVLTGGFKITSQYKQNYKGAGLSVDNALPVIDNCYHTFLPLSLDIRSECIGTFENRYKTTVSGGSGNFSYQYKWKTNIPNNIYSPYVNGSNEMLIPYAPKYCSGDSSGGTFGKVWSFVVKVTDLTTGQTIEKSYETETACTFTTNSRSFEDVEISNCSNFCSPNEMRFKIHLDDIGLSGNFKYEYAYYDPSVGFYQQTLNWIDVTSTQGSFCPSFSTTADSNCPSGYRNVIYFTYRITNLSTSEVTYHLPQIYYGDCTSCNNCMLRNSSSEDLEYAQKGTLVSKDANGKILNVRTINNTTK